MTFEQAVQHVLREEGGYANNPNDAGGETNFGISKRSYPHLNIRELTREMAVSIYERDYWRAAHCADAPDLLQLALFDAAVNCGVGTAVRWAQAVCGATPDGMVGPKTLEKWAAADGRSALEEFMWIRAQHHARLAGSAKSQRDFLPGWILRCHRVRATALAP